MINCRDLLHRIKSVFKIASLTSVDDSGNIQRGQFKYMGTEPTGQIFIPYGVMMNAPTGSQVMVFAQNGNASNPVALVGDPQNRILKNLEAGEFAIGNYLTGSYLLFKANGDIETLCNGNVINTVSGNLTNTVGGSLANEITGAVTQNATGTTLNNDITVSTISFLDHVHAQNADSDGNTQVDTEAPK